MSIPAIYVYPHSKKQFSDLYKIESYIVSRLQRGSGLYHHTDVRELTRGSIVLFLYSKRIVGDGVVSKAEKSFEEEDYDNWPIRIKFVPRMVRLFPHYVHLKELTQLPEFKSFEKFEEKAGKRRGWPFRVAFPISPNSYLVILQKAIQDE